MGADLSMVGLGLASGPMQKHRIALIHATPLAMQPIADAFAMHWSDVECFHLLDDSLSKDLAKQGQLTPAMVQRFVDLSLYAKSTGADACLFTCSAFGPAIEAAHQASGLPTLKPNEAMFEQALAMAKPERNLRVGLVATFEASIAALSQELLALAAARGVTVLLHTLFVPEAMQDLARGNKDVHDQKIVDALATFQPCDVVMLGQFSMASAQKQAQQIMPCPVLTSPVCAVQMLQARLGAQS